MNSPATNSFRVLYFGDSLTEGASMPPEQRALVWPNLVEKDSHGKFRAINEGKGGRPTDSVAEFRVALERGRDGFDLLVVALGGNDARDISGQCVPNAVRNIGEMVGIARAMRPDLRILLVGPANIRKDALGPTRPIANERDQNLRDLTKAFEVLAEELSCAFTPLYGIVPPESLAMDGVHPDAEGNGPMAAHLLGALNRLIG